MKVTVTRSAPYHVVGFQGGGRYGKSQFTRRDYKANVAGKDFTNTNKAELTRRIRFYVRKLEQEAGFVSVPVQFEFVDEPGASPASNRCSRKSSHGSHGRCPGVDFPRDFSMARS